MYIRDRALFVLAATPCSAPLATSLPAHADEPLKIDPLVKMSEQTWFINEQKTTTELGQKNGFSVVNIGTLDSEKVLSTIDNLGAQGAEGLVICAPDVRLGPAISARAKHYNMKFVAVNDQLVDSSSRPLTNVPHPDMPAFKIGNQVDRAISDGVKHHGQKPEEVDMLRITNYELPIAKLRTDGVTQTLLTGGFKKENTFDAPQETTDDTRGSNTASPVLAQHAGIRERVILALNEESVLGGVRTTGQLYIPAADMTGVGINDTGEAFTESQKEEQTGPFGTTAVSSTNHGKGSAVNLVEWTKTGKQPPADTQTTDKLMVRSN